MKWRANTNLGASQKFCLSKLGIQVRGTWAGLTKQDLKFWLIDIEAVLVVYQSLPDFPPEKKSNRTYKIKKLCLKYF